MDFLDCCWPIGWALDAGVDEVGSVWEDCGRDLDNLEVSAERREGASFGDVTVDHRDGASRVG